jgi:hypothetical protein
MESFFLTPRGVLPGNFEMLARLIGWPVAEVTPLLYELERNNVFTRGAEVGHNLPSDAIVNRRMYSKWLAIEQKREAGRASAEARRQRAIEQNANRPPNRTPTERQQTHQQKGQQNANGETQPNSNYDTSLHNAELNTTATDVSVEDQLLELESELELKREDQDKVTNREAPDAVPVGGKPPTLGDRLSSYPSLEEFYPHLVEMIREVHPKANVPASGKRLVEWRANLAALVHLDGYTEADVIDCLTWLFKREYQPSDGGFSWRQQVQSIPGLRHRKNGRADNPMKIDRIMDAWRRAEASAAGHYTGDEEVGF